MGSVFQKSEPQAVRAYVAELERRLRRDMPVDRAEQIANETSAHLEDRVEELIRQGVARREAESIAIAGFGPVHRYTRAATVSTYGDRHTARWRCAGRIAAAVFLTFLVQATALRLEQTLPQPWQLLAMGVVPLCPLLLAVSAFRSRLPQTRTLLTYIAGALLTVFIGAGLMYVPSADTPAVQFARLNSPTESSHGGPGLHRAQNPRWIETVIKDGEFARREAALLRQGVRVYRDGQAVPASLMRGNRFIVPRTSGVAWYLNGSYAGSDTSAFKDLDLYTDHLGDEESRLDTLPYQTVATRQEAAQAWTRHGQLWLSGKTRRIDYHNREVAVLQRATTAPPGFNPGAATYHASYLIWLSLPLLLLDFLMAHLGRILHIWTRNRRRAHTA